MAKRLMCLLLALVTMFSLCVPGFASEGQEDAVVQDANQVQIGGNNPVGDLIAGEVSQQADTKEAAGDVITGLTVSDRGTSVTVNFRTGSEADVVVAVYDESTGKMLTSGTARVGAGATAASVSLKERAPSTFLVSAFLLDASSHQPLCPEYTSSLYTEEMKDFLSTDIHDYEEDRVVNLDGSDTTNFMVYGEDTVVVAQDSVTNALTDNGNGTYTVTGADSSFTSLQPGDVFTYEYSDGSLLPVKVASVTVDGTTVTITEDPSITLEDVFDVVRIEFGSEEGGPAPAMEFKGKDSFRFGFNVKLGENGSVSGDTGANISLKLYKTWKQKFVDFSISYSVKGTFKIKGEGEKGVFPLMAPIQMYPLPCVTVQITPAFVVQPKGSIEFSAEIKGKIAWEIDGDKKTDKSNPASFKPSIKMEGSVFVGFSLEPELVVVHQKLASISLTAEAGFEIKGSYELLDQFEKDSKHSCNECIDGDVSLKLDASVEITVAGWLELKWDILSLSYKLFDFYYCKDKQEFGLGTCPYIVYSVTMTVLDKDGKPVEGAVIGDTGLLEDPVTNKKGVATFYLPSGTYILTVTNADKTASAWPEVLIEDGKRNIDVTLIDGATSPDPGGSGGGSGSSGDGNIRRFGYCGEEGTNLQWTLMEDGTLLILGKGEMEDYATATRVPWNSNYVKKVVVQNGVTSIGSFAFAYCGLTSMVIPSSVTKIGTSVFGKCKSLTSVTISDSVTVLEDRTFEDCSSLTQVNLPDGLTSIERSAFSGCASLAEIELPDSLTSIERSAFSGCTSLTEIDIPAAVTSVDKDAFYGCVSLEEINVAPGNPVYKSVDGLVLDAAGTTLIRCPQGRLECTIPNGVTTVGEDALSDCVMLESVTIPASVTSIGPYGFSYCTALMGIEIPGSVASIGEGAFYNCSELTDVTIRNGVTSIGSEAFYKCSSLREIEFPASVAKAGSDVFEDCGLQKITIQNPNCDLPGDFLGFNVYTVFYGYAGSTTQAFVDPNTAFWYGWRFVSLGEAPASMAELEDGEAEPTATPEPTPEPTAEPEVTAEPSPEPTAEPEVTAEPSPEPTAEPEVTAEPSPEPTAEPTPEATAEPTATPEPTPEPTAEPEVTAEPSPEPTAEPEVTAEPTPEATAEPEVTAEPTAEPEVPEAQGFEPVDASQEKQETDVQPAAAFTGSVSGQTALFTGLRAQADYVVLVVISTAEAGLLSSDNLLFIAQVPADSKGNIALAYVPRSDEAAQVRAYGPVGTLPAPKLKKAVSVAGGVEITWNEVQDAEKYRVYYKVNGKGSWKKAGETEETSFVWKKAKSGTKYSFTVRCVSEDGKLTLSSYNKTGKSVTYVAAPKVSKVKRSGSSVTVTWGKVKGAVKYRVYYRIGNGSWKKLGDTTKTSYTWKKAKSSTIYSFTVRCISKNGKSYTSGYDTTGKALAVKKSPTVKVSKASGGIKVSWGKIQGAEKYRIYYKVNGKGSWKKLTDTTATKYTWKAAKSGTKYSFTVRCITANGKSFTSSYNKTGKSIRYKK